MLIRTPRLNDVKSSEITTQETFRARRRFLATSIFGGAALAAFPHIAAAEKLQGVIKTAYTVDEALTPLSDVTSYNNFYEFGTGKDDPVDQAKDFTTDQWTIEVEGLTAKPGTVDLADLMKGLAIEERVYRHRCVEAWSMVVPWNGVPLASIIKKLQPLGSARYVAFETLNDPARMPGLNRRVLDWPYKEGLRMDEALHPMTLLATGVYGETMPPQNGAPVRLITPWKYGFKGIKSIAKIIFTDKQPPTSWNQSAPGEYGFYANVNPEVSHPRWSQAKERRIGEFLRRPTLPFNGYGEEVASLYSGMNLSQFY